jgi:hypothetical protein
MDTDLLFPPRAITALRNLRGAAWQELVDRVQSDDPLKPDRLAFVYMMVKLGGCTNCQADSFRAMRGCTQCASQTIKRFKGSDQELITIFDMSKNEVERFLNKE